jgi:hypothetical protein
VYVNDIAREMLALGLFRVFRVGFRVRLMLLLHLLLLVRDIRSGVGTLRDGLRPRFAKPEIKTKARLSIPNTPSALA